MVVADQRGETARLNLEKSSYWSAASHPVLLHKMQDGKSTTATNPALAVCHIDTEPAHDHKFVAITAAG